MKSTTHSPGYLSKNNYSYCFQMKVPKDLQGTMTITKYLSRANALFGHARINGETTLNPAEGMTVKKTKRADEARQIFTTDDLISIFGSSGYTENKFKNPYQFWTPVLALFTGAGLNEIAQLYLSDFQKNDGIWCININDEDDKKIKNRAGKRIIPLHPFLVEDLDIIRNDKTSIPII